MGINRLNRLRNLAAGEGEKNSPTRQMVGIGIVGIGFMGMKLTSVHTGLESRPSLQKDAPDAGFHALVRICESLETVSCKPINTYSSAVAENCS